MTSLLSRLTGSATGVQGATIKPADVRSRLEAAEAALRGLRLRYAPVAFKADSGDPDAIAELAELNRLTREAEDKIRSLTASLGEAERLEALAEQIARENLFHSQAQAQRAHFAAMKSAAAEYTAAEVARDKAWKKLLTHRDKAQNATPIGFVLPGDFPKIGQLAKLASFESYRVGHAIEDHPGSLRNLPGSAFPAGFERQPDKITPFTDHVTGFCDAASTKLKAHADAFRSA